MASKIVSVSLCDKLIFQLGHLVPNYLQGIFKRSPFWTGFFHRFHPDPSGRRLIAKWRRKYHARCFVVSLFGARTVLVVDPYSVRRVLEHSPAVYADPRPKQKGMAHFQPDAVTISRPPLWDLRRRFNEEVLATGRLHPFGDAFVAVIREETKNLAKTTTDRITWPALDGLFTRITLQIVFGKHALNDVGMLEALDRLMLQANRLLFLKRNPRFDRLYERIEHYLKAPEPNTLAARCREVLETMPTALRLTPDKINVASQMPHWLFAMKDTLALNTAACLTLLADHPACCERAQADIALWDGSASGLGAAKYLEACVEETMRLWPTTPMLVRECIVADILADDMILPGTQVIIWNAANHRNTEAYADAGLFRPERWSEPQFGTWFNHLSSSTQACAGRDLALLIAKTVVAELLRDHYYQNHAKIAEPGQSVPDSFNACQLKLERTASAERPEVQP
jgi:cytochrome P450